jgi:glutaredoxin|tara:strand:+ start:2270 stop:2536 length:267 start_codon:yes stop_codon:yes gene_type:complete
MKAIVWSKDNCTYCDQAKKLLEAKGIDYEEKKIGHGYTLEDLLAVVPDARTAPQIFLDTKYIGGFMELKEEMITFNTNEEGVDNRSHT